MREIFLIRANVDRIAGKEIMQIGRAIPGQERSDTDHASRHLIWAFGRRRHSIEGSAPDLRTFEGAEDR
jgi:hypothetical protein